MYPNRSNLEDHSYAALAFAASLPFCGKPSALPKSKFPLQLLDLRFLSLTFPFQHALSRGPRRRIVRKPAIPRFAQRTPLRGKQICGGVGNPIAGVYILSIFEIRLEFFPLPLFRCGEPFLLGTSTGEPWSYPLVG